MSAILTLFGKRAARKNRGRKGGVALQPREAQLAGQRFAVSGALEAEAPLKRGGSKGQGAQGCAQQAEQHAQLVGAVERFRVALAEVGAAPGVGLVSERKRLVEALAAEEKKHAVGIRFADVAAGTRTQHSYVGCGFYTA